MFLTSANNLFKSKNLPQRCGIDETVCLMFYLGHSFYVSHIYFPGISKLLQYGKSNAVTNKGIRVITTILCEIKVKWCVGLEFFLYILPTDHHEEADLSVSAHVPLFILPSCLYKHCSPYSISTHCGLAHVMGYIWALQSRIFIMP